jgi:CRISPR-associated protein (TIGR02584 family)
VKNVLLAVAGLSPQVITEALYALLSEGRQPHCVQIITTRQGKDRVLAGLFDPQATRLANLLADFGLDTKQLDLNPANIHTLKNNAGVELDDIISPEDNEDLLRLCLDLSFHYTRDKDNAVWFLVAGGRKTMTSCLTLAAQLYGRPQDRILHVLVSPEFEGCREFWYPPKEPVTIQLTDAQGQPFFKQTRYAAIQLITIPFVSVRERLQEDLLDQPRTPADLMQTLIRDRPLLLTNNLTEGKVVFGGLELDMHPTRLAIYAFFAERKKECRLDRPCAGCDTCFLDASEIVASEKVSAMYRRIPGGRLVEEMSDSGIRALSRENFQSYKSKIRRELLAAFGQSRLAELEIAAAGSRPDTRYGIRLDRHRIRMEW